MRTSVSRILAAALLVAASAAAATGEKSDSTLLADPYVAAHGGYVGATVLWGGRVVGRVAVSGAECLEVAAYPLRRSDGRPEPSEAARPGQHFLACGDDGFVAKSRGIGSDLTVAGTVASVQQRTVKTRCSYVVDAAGRLDDASLRQDRDGGCELSLPVVAVSDARSWPERPSRDGAPRM